MSDEQAVKVAKAKLYNLRSSIDGMIPLIESGIIDPAAVPDALGALISKIVDELDKSP